METESLILLIIPVTIFYSFLTLKAERDEQRKKRNSRKAKPWR